MLMALEIAAIFAASITFEATFIISFLFLSYFVIWADLWIFQAHLYSSQRSSALKSDAKLVKIFTI
jgi:hypothetical protein